MFAMSHMIKENNGPFAMVIVHVLKSQSFIVKETRGRFKQSETRKSKKYKSC